MPNPTILNIIDVITYLGTRMCQQTLNPTSKVVHACITMIRKRVHQKIHLYHHCSCFNFKPVLFIQKLGEKMVIAKRLVLIVIINMVLSKMSQNWSEMISIRYCDSLGKPEQTLELVGFDIMHYNN